MRCIISNSGVQNQLAFLQGSGCFSFWAGGECSLWLTALTTMGFSMMHETESKDINTYTYTYKGREKLFVSNSKSTGKCFSKYNLKMSFFTTISSFFSRYS